MTETETISTCKEEKTFTPTTEVFLEILFREDNDRKYPMTIDEIARIFQARRTKRDTIKLVDILIAKDYCCKKAEPQQMPVIVTTYEGRKAHRYLCSLWKEKRKHLLDSKRG